MNERTQEKELTIIDPNAMWWIVWRIDGDLCAHSLAPAKTALAAEVAEKVGNVYGIKNVWLEAAEVSP